MPYRIQLMVCGGTDCIANRSLEFRDALQEELAKRGLARRFRSCPQVATASAASAP